MSKWFNHNFAHGLTNLSYGFKQLLSYKEQHDWTKLNRVLAPIPRSENSAYSTYAFRSHCKCFLRKYAWLHKYCNESGRCRTQLAVQRSDGNRLSAVLTRDFFGRECGVVLILANLSIEPWMVAHLGIGWICPYQASTSTQPKNAIWNPNRDKSPSGRLTTTCRVPPQFALFLPCCAWRSSCNPIPDWSPDSHLLPTLYLAYNTNWSWDVVTRLKSFQSNVIIKSVTSDPGLMRRCHTDAHLSLQSNNIATLIGIMLLVKWQIGYPPHCLKNCCYPFTGT